jgi:hypothetical protein
VQCATTKEQDTLLKLTNNPKSLETLPSPIGFSFILQKISNTIIFVSDLGWGGALPSTQRLEDKPVNGSVDEEFPCKARHNAGASYDGDMRYLQDKQNAIPKLI